MMTLNEAITHAEEQAEKLSLCSCGEDHKQLAGWLKELRTLREVNYADL